MNKNTTKIKRLIFIVNLLIEMLKEYEKDESNAVVKIALKECLNIQNKKLIDKASKYGIHLVINKDIYENDYNILLKLLQNYLVIAQK